MMRIATRGILLPLLMMAAHSACSGSSEEQGSKGGDAGPDGGMLSCSPGTADCNQIESDGCEADLQGSILNCGTCGHSCVEGTCENGKCKPAPVLLAQDAIVVGMASNGENLYWTGKSSPAYLYRLPITGGDVVNVATGGDNAVGVALTPTHVYWTTAGTGFDDGAVWGKKLTSGAAETLAANQTGAWDVAVDETWVYWTNEGTYPSYDDGAVMRVPLASGAVETVATYRHFPTRITGDATHVYWVESSERVVATTKQSVGPALIMYTGSGIHDLAVGAAFVYFGSDGSLYRLDKSGAFPAEAMVSDVGELAAIAIDDTHVYWTSWSDPVRRIMRMANEGGEPQVLSEKECADPEVPTCEPLALCLDDVNVYFSERLNGIFKLAKTP